MQAVLARAIAYKVLLSVDKAVAVADGAHGSHRGATAEPALAARASDHYKQKGDAERSSLA